MEAGAKLGQRTPDRVAQRNGYRPRAWNTRVVRWSCGPRLRTGSFFPSFLEPRRRAKQALVAVVQEAYVNGVSRRQMDRLRDEVRVTIEQVAAHLEISVSKVSRIETARWVRPRGTCGTSPRSSVCRASA